MSAQNPGTTSSFYPVGMTTWSSELNHGQTYTSSYTPNHSERLRVSRTASTLQAPPVVSAFIESIRNVRVATKRGGCCSTDLAWNIFFHLVFLFLGITNLSDGLATCTLCGEMGVEECKKYNNWDDECDPYDESSPGQNIYLFFLFYALIVYHASCGSYTAKYLSNTKDASALNAYISKVRKNKMKVSASVACYHYERKTTGTGKHRKTRTVKVTSYRETRDWLYEGCVDYSSNGVDSEGFLVVRVESRVEQEFGDAASSEKFESLCAKIISDNKHRDQHINLTKHFDLEGIEEKQLLRKEPKTPKERKDLAWCSYFRLFLLSFIPFASTAYFIFFHRLTGGAVLLFKKKLFLDAQPEVVEVEHFAVAVPLATAVAESDTYWADIQAQTNSNAVLVEAVSVDIEGGEY
ncbi:hypothetical protein TrCOL_g6092 [Triparma columacea]|uniref:Uncharacterized protein n=1 Tax=Triparma columacea TaxID=722753 RepID=A0A9W7GQD3_9STRA|nr:hypothetical protein TrCOL_g6092 [Triparma columacea]